MLSQKAKYALRALVALAEAGEGRSLHIAEIAERQRLPRKFLEQIMLDLKHHGVVHSRRGRHGGCALLRPPEAITFGEVIRIIDGPIAPLPCLSRSAYRRCADCPDEGRCAIRRVLALSHEATVNVLDSMSLADALAEPAPSHELA
jgi:Rrf2 family protein